MAFRLTSVSSQITYTGILVGSTGAQTVLFRAQLNPGDTAGRILQGWASSTTQWQVTLLLVNGGQDIELRYFRRGATNSLSKKAIWPADTLKHSYSIRDAGTGAASGVAILRDHAAGTPENIDDAAGAMTAADTFTVGQDLNMSDAATGTELSDFCYANADIGVGPAKTFVTGRALANITGLDWWRTLLYGADEGSGVGTSSVSGGAFDVDPTEMDAEELAAAYTAELTAFRARTQANDATIQALRADAEVAAALDQDIVDAIAEVEDKMETVGGPGGEGQLSAAVNAMQAARAANSTVAALDTEIAELRDGNKMGAAEANLAAIVAVKHGGGAPGPMAVVMRGRR